MILPLLLLLAFSSCEQPEKRPAKTTETPATPVIPETPVTPATSKTKTLRPITLCGREGEQPIYQAEIPLSWKKIDPKSHQNLTDTTLPICSFEAGNILITVHNFPYSTLEQRIPPSAQIARWKEQFQIHDGDVTPSAHGGFGGYRLEAQDPNGKGMIAYAMQMTPILFRILSNPQIKADYTIKAVGPIAEIESEKDAIDAFALSFELKEPIDSPL